MRAGPSTPVAGPEGMLGRHRFPGAPVDDDDVLPAPERRRFDSDLLEAFDRVRQELRDEIQRSEGRVQDAIGELRTDFEAATTTHAGIHAAEGESRSIAHKRFEDFMLKAEIAQARRDGALGVIRFGVDLLGRNWRGIVAVGAAAAVLLGNVQVDVGLGS